jgi:putative holliday junction resolvase
VAFFCAEVKAGKNPRSIGARRYFCRNFQTFILFCTFATDKEIMGRILAIDYGRKRVGLAVTDPMQIIASPLTTIPANEIETFLTDYLKNEEVTEFVVGYPVQMNNKPSESVKYIDPFLKRLGKLFPGKPVKLFDERFTSKMALRTMIDGGVKKKDRRDKSMVDRISASLILQSYLEKRAFITGKEKKK